MPGPRRVYRSLWRGYDTGATTPNLKKDGLTLGDAWRRPNQLGSPMEAG